MFDFNDAEAQFSGGQLIPDGTICVVVASLRPGQSGDGGWLKASQTGCDMLDFEFTVDGGEYDRRKLWGLYVTNGVTEGHEKAANITRGRLRAMLESASGFLPNDSSAEAVAARQVSSWEGFDGLSFCARIGVEQGGLKDKTAGPNSERYNDKNVIGNVITPEDPDYIKPGSATKKAAAKPAIPAAKPAGGATPSWAK